MATALVLKMNKRKTFAFFMKESEAVREARLLAREPGVSFVGVVKGNGNVIERLRKGGMYPKDSLYEDAEWEGGDG